MRHSDAIAVAPQLVGCRRAKLEKMPWACIEMASTGQLPLLV
jgi:hypothetical protein